MPARHTHHIELPRRAFSKPPVDHTGTRYCARLASCFTLFLFGPRRRDLGFHCSKRGWVPLREFTAAGRPGEVGKGCE